MRSSGRSHPRATRSGEYACRRRATAVRELLRGRLGITGPGDRRGRWPPRSTFLKPRPTSRWPPWRAKASFFGATSRRNDVSSWSGATAGCWPGSTATRSIGCGRRSSRSARRTSCASCSPGSGWIPEIGSAGSKDWHRSWAARWLRAAGRSLGERSALVPVRGVRSRSARHPVPDRTGGMGPAGLAAHGRAGASGPIRATSIALVPAGARGAWLSRSVGAQR